MARDTRNEAGDNGHSAVDHDRLRAEIHHLEASLHYWQARWHHTPGPSDPSTPRHRIQRVIDLLGLPGETEKFWALAWSSCARSGLWHLLAAVLLEGLKAHQRAFEIGLWA
jgi:hypothetical protein